MRMTLGLMILGWLSLTKAFGAPIVDVHGDSIETGGIILSVLGSAVASWSSSDAYTNVNISANFSAAPGTYSGTAYLTTKIGPGTTTASEVAKAQFRADLTAFPFQNSFTIFEGLSLSPGTYYLTMSSSSPGDTAFGSEAAAHHTQIKTGPGTKLGAYLWSFGNSQVDYAPDSTYSAYLFSPLEFLVTGQSVPEPSTGSLSTSVAIIAVGGLIVMRKSLFRLPVR